MKEIILPKTTEIEIITRESVKVITDKISIQQLIDDGKSVKAFIMANNRNTFLTLWEGQSYIDIDQWTDQDVKDKIIELLS